MRNKVILVCVAVVVSSGSVYAQTAPGDTETQTQDSSQSSSGRQPKRILGVIPNYRSVSADTRLPPLSAKDKFGLAAKDSFDYSSFIFAGMLAGVGQIDSSEPEFGSGAAAYGRYYWHSLADEVSGNFATEFLVPAITHEDPRYYTLGRGGFFHRTGYAIGRLVITKTDSDHRSLNWSEIVGNGMSAGLSDFYYPSAQRTWVKTRQKWGTQIALDGIFNVFKEFWPDIAAWLSHEQ